MEKARVRPAKAETMRAVSYFPLATPPLAVLMNRGAGGVDRGKARRRIGRSDLNIFD